MTGKEAVERIKMILKECTSDEDAVCYVTSDDADALNTAIKALEQEPCDDIKEYYKDIWDCDINHPRYEDTVAEIVEKSYMSGYVQGVENTAKEFRFELEQEPCEDTHKKCHNINPDYAECDQFVCSNCGIELQDWHRVERDEDGDVTYHEYEFHFCPNCGADMRGEQDENR